MQKEKVVQQLNNKGYKCELTNSIPVVLLETYTENEISIVKSLIPEYVGSICYKPLRNTTVVDND